ncbi:hypothetical protein M5362_01175 [Streptomyces sp. Je 1-79]|uniref:hypothetical protein n=1 Tax=Streptomyces sp. Je 1-79 TaxID=2943847 RepID=UPI0021A4F1C3|nr:hypothetical protein [Streptomyces sp. Je 1-79]MCT4351744.1 hypothetical protein [Streptomyces sp. Je 1-79]
MEALFKAMAADFLLREQFVTDPAQIVAEYVRGERLEQRRAEDTNRLIHAVMSNPGLVRWIRDFARRARQNGAAPDSGLADFGRAVIDNRATHVVTALAACSGEQSGVVGFDTSFLRVVADSGIFGVTASTEVSGTHMSTGGSGTDPLTESSGTHVSLAADADPLTEVSGTHVSTGGSGTDPLTESSGTHVSLPADADPLTEVSGTHMSTGGSGTDPLTESSGTHVSLAAMSADDVGRILGSGSGKVALEALMRYSVELRDRGLLDRPGTW